MVFLNGYIKLDDRPIFFFPFITLYLVHILLLSPLPSPSM